MVNPIYDELNFFLSFMLQLDAIHCIGFIARDS